MNTESSRLSAVQIGIIILTLATALIHFSLLFPNVMFILNGLGYLTLLAAYFLPIDLARNNHNLRLAFLVGETADNYITIPGGASYTDSGLVAEAGDGRTAMKMVQELQ